VPPGKTTKSSGKSKAERLIRESRPAVGPATPLRAPTPEREALAADVSSVCRNVVGLMRRATELGISRQGLEATGPHANELSRDVAEGLFVAWRALQATSAFVQHGGETWRDFRAQIRRARNVLRGGRADDSTPADRSIAVDMARQAILYALGYGFRGCTRDDALQLIRDSYADNYCPEFRQTPDDASILVHFGVDSRANRAFVKWSRGEIQQGALQREIELSALMLARDVLWSARNAAGNRYPMDPKDTSPAKLLARLQAAARDKGKRP
jgi:hypothetical protein